MLNSASEAPILPAPRVRLRGTHGLRLSLKLAWALPWLTAQFSKLKVWVISHGRSQANPDGSSLPLQWNHTKEYVSNDMTT